MKLTLSKGKVNMDDLDKVKIDDLDRELLKLYYEDSRQSFSKIATKLGIDASTARRRTNKLVRNGCMTFRAVSNPTLLGFTVQAYLAFNVLPGYTANVIKGLVNQENIRYARAISGQFDILAHAWFESNSAIYHFKEEILAGMEGVKDIHILICLSTVEDALR